LDRSAFGPRFREEGQNDRLTSEFGELDGLLEQAVARGARQCKIGRHCPYLGRERRRAGLGLLRRQNGRGACQERGGKSANASVMRHRIRLDLMMKVKMTGLGARSNDL